MESHETKNAVKETSRMKIMKMMMVIMMMMMMTMMMMMMMRNMKMMMMWSIQPYIRMDDSRSFLDQKVIELPRLS